MVTNEEIAMLNRQLVALIGYDQSKGEVKGLGSGFTIGVRGPDVYVLTAAHILLGFAREIIDANKRPHAFAGIVGDEEEDGRKVTKIVERGLVKALVRHENSGEVVEMDLWSVAAGLDELDCDVALLQCRAAGPEGPPNVIECFPLDLDPLDSDETVVIAGFFQAPIVKFEDADGVRAFRNTMIMRAGRVMEVTTATGWNRGRFPVIRSLIPSFPGMSGGPLLRLRYPRGKSPIMGAFTRRFGCSREKLTG
jgi:hypothetical protein